MQHYTYLPFSADYINTIKQKMRVYSCSRLIFPLAIAIVINLAATIFPGTSLLYILQFVLNIRVFVLVILLIYNIICIKKMDKKQLKKALSIDGAFVEILNNGLILQTEPITGETLNDCAPLLTCLAKEYPDSLGLVKRIKEWIFSDNIELKTKAVIYTEIILDQLSKGNLQILETYDSIKNFVEKPFDIDKDVVPGL